MYNETCISKLQIALWYKNYIRILSIGTSNAILLRSIAKSKKGNLLNQTMVQQLA